MEQRVKGTLEIWANPFTPLRVPKVFPLLKNLGRYVRFGSLADTDERIRDVRFALESGHPPASASMSAKCQKRT